LRGYRPASVGMNGADWRQFAPRIAPRSSL
jgi:hypothetical protein